MLKETLDHEMMGSFDELARGIAFIPFATAAESDVVKEVLENVLPTLEVSDRVELTSQFTSITRFS